jgi:hypothetical protein
VTISAANTIGDTQVNLTVSVDPHAPTGPASLTLGTSTLAGHLTITPQPLATYCDTARLAQAMTPVTQVITVTGQAFSQPAVAIALSAVQTVPGRHTNPVSVLSTTSTASELLITVAIAASSYTPYEPPDPTGNRAPIAAQGSAGGATGTTHYRPPSHVLVNLTLTVTPALHAAPSTFPIVVDTIV